MGLPVCQVPAEGADQLFSVNANYHFGRGHASKSCGPTQILLLCSWRFGIFNRRSMSSLMRSRLDGSAGTIWWRKEPHVTLKSAPILKHP